MTTNNYYNVTFKSIKTINLEDWKTVPAGHLRPRHCPHCRLSKKGNCVKSEADEEYKVYLTKLEINQPKKRHSYNAFWTVKW
jgi:hypothetical protein